MDFLHRHAWENTSDMMLPYTLDMLQQELSQLSAVQKQSKTDRARPVSSGMSPEVPGLWRTRYENIPIEMLLPTRFQAPNSLGGGIPIGSPQYSLAYYYRTVAAKPDEVQPTSNPESSHDGPSLTNSQRQEQPTRSSALIGSASVNKVDSEDPEIMVRMRSSATTPPAFGAKAASIPPLNFSPSLSPPSIPKPLTPETTIPAASGTRETTSKKKGKTVVRPAFREVTTELPPDVTMLNLPPGEVMRSVTDDDIRVFKPWSAAAGRSPFEPFYPPLGLEAVPSHHLTHSLMNVDFQQYDIPQLYLTPQEYSRSKVLQSDNEPEADTGSERTERQEPGEPRVPPLGSLGRMPVDSTHHITPFRGPITPVATLSMSIPAPTPVRQEQHQGVSDHTPRKPQAGFVSKGIIPPSPSSSPGIAHSRAQSPQGFQPPRSHVDPPASGTPHTHREPWYSEVPHTGVLLQPSATGPITAVPQPQQPHVDVGDIREMLDLLRRNDRAQQIALDHQREVIRYLGDLNGWLERDAHDRQTDMTSLAARLDRLRDELNQRLPLLF